MAENVHKNKDEEAIIRATAMTPRSSVVLDRIAFVILVATFFLLPIVGFPLSGLALAFGKQAMLATGTLIAFLLWLVARLQDGKLSVSGNWILGALGLVSLVALLSGLFSGSIGYSLIGYGNEVGTFSNILILSILAFLVAHYLNSAERILRVWVALSLSFVIVAVLQILHLFGMDIQSLGLMGAKSVTMLGKWNHLAIFAGLFTVLSIVGHQLFPPVGRFKHVMVGLCTLSLAVLLIVNFYLAWIVVGAFALVVSIYAFTAGRGDKGERRIITPALITLIIAIVMLFASGAWAGVLAGIGITSAEVRPSWQGTFSIVKGTLGDRPLLGVGPNRFTSAWLSYKPDEVNLSPFWNLEFASGVGTIPSRIVTEGALGGLAWLLFVLVILYYSYRAIVLKLNGISRALLLSAVFASLYLLIFAVVYTPGVTVWALTFLAIGVLMAALTHAKLTSNIEIAFLRNSRSGFLSVVFIVILMLLTVTGGYTLARRYHAFALFGAGTLSFGEEQDLEKAEGFLGRAVALSEQDIFYRGLSELNLQRLRLLARQEGAPEEALRTQFQSTLSSAITNATRSTELIPSNPANWLALARVFEAVVPLQIEGAYERSIESYARAALLNPKSPAIDLSLARQEVVRGDRALARERIDAALAKKSNYTEALFLLSQIEADAGNIEAAIMNAEQAAILAGNDVGAFFQLGLLRYMNKDYEPAAGALIEAIRLSPRQQFDNAKYFLALSLDRLDRTSDAITLFGELQASNPDNEEVKTILGNLRAGRPALSGIGSRPSERDSLPIEETVPDDASEE